MKQLCISGFSKDGAETLIKDAVLRGNLALQLRRLPFRAPTPEERGDLAFENGELTCVDRDAPIMLSGGDDDGGAGGVFSLWRGSRCPVDLNVLDLLDRATRASRVSPAGAEKNRGGRPAIHDWNAAIREASAWIFHNGIPEPRAKLVRYLAAWFEETKGNAPDDREIERSVADLVKDFDKVRPERFGEGE